MIVNPLCIAADQADTACGTGDSHVVVGACPYGHRVCSIVDDGVDQDWESGTKTGCILSVDIVDHESPAVFFRSFKSSNRSIITYGGQERFYRDDITISTILCVDGHAV